MAFLLSFIDNTPPRQTTETAEPYLPPRAIAGSPKSALLVEDDGVLSPFLKRRLKGEGYSVRTASNAEEGLRLYRDIGPFNVVVINYCVPRYKDHGIDPLAPQTNGIELAIAIRDIDPTQSIILAAFAFRTAAEVLRPPEVMDIPVLLDCSAFQLRSVLEKVEIDLAIKTLSTADLTRLRNVAILLIRGLGRAARGRDWEDLLDEAQCRTLIGAGNSQNGRHWNRNVPFVQHLAGAMKSIASLWRRQFREYEGYLVSELTVCDEEGQERSPIDSIPSDCTPADRRLIDKSEEERVFALFRDDEYATCILRGIVDGLQKHEIKLAYGLDEKKYAATMRRLRVRLMGRESKGQEYEK
jgi:CheY-like chemotaxis protein